mmetsp:Transcript_69665/g.193886  ORF Transcript_69665/g.193886 Transcript_69665/m.193886 type:complete len:285 (+) Transcript_69665:847-1701(+)
MSRYWRSRDLQGISSSARERRMPATKLWSAPRSAVSRSDRNCRTLHSRPAFDSSSLPLYTRPCIAPVQDITILCNADSASSASHSNPSRPSRRKMSRYVQCSIRNSCGFVKYICCNSSSRRNNLVDRSEAFTDGAAAAASSSSACTRSAGTTSWPSRWRTLRRTQRSGARPPSSMPQSEAGSAGASLIVRSPSSATKAGSLTFSPASRCAARRPTLSEAFISTNGTPAAPAALAPAAAKSNPQRSLRKAGSAGISSIATSKPSFAEAFTRCWLHLASSTTLPSG